MTETGSPQIHVWTDDWLSNEEPALKLRERSVRPKYIAIACLVNTAVSGVVSEVVGSSNHESLTVAAFFGGVTALAGYVMHKNESQEINLNRSNRELIMRSDQAQWDVRSLRAKPVKSSNKPAI